MIRRDNPLCSVLRPMAGGRIDVGQVTIDRWVSRRAPPLSTLWPVQTDYRKGRRFHPCVKSKRDLASGRASDGGQGSLLARDALRGKGGFFWRWFRGTEQLNESSHRGFRQIHCFYNVIYRFPVIQQTLYL